MQKFEYIEEINVQKENSIQEEENIEKINSQKKFPSKRYKIQEVIKPDQIILVQILKDERDLVTTQAQTALGNAAGGEGLLSTILGNLGQIDPATGGIAGFHEDFDSRLATLQGRKDISPAVINQAIELIRNALPAAAKDAIAEIDTNIGNIEDASTNAVNAISKEFEKIFNLGLA